MKGFSKGKFEVSKDSLFIIFICIITLLVLKNTVLQNMYYKQDFKAEDLYYNYILNEENKGSIDETSKYSGVFSYGPYINLKKGDYIITINYKSTCDNIVEVTGGKGDFGIDNRVLPANKSEYSFPLKMIYDEKQEGLGIEINYSGKGSLKISDIQIKKESNSRELALIVFYILFVLTGTAKLKGKNKYLLIGYISLMYMLLSSIFIRNIPFMILMLLVLYILLELIERRRLLHNKIFLIYSYLILFAFITMFFCSKSSAFYSINDWVDSQCYFTMGKGMMNGQAVYKDLFEQKGPLLFLLYGIGYWICKTDFYGIYFLESIFFGVLLIFSFKLSSLFLSKRYAFLSSMIFSICILYQKFFRYGGSCEEFILPLIMISLYFFVKFFKEEKDKHSPKIMFLHGILGACVLLMKFNIAVFWGGFGIIIFVRMVYKKEFKCIAKNLIAVILGAFLMILPFMIYLMAKNCINEFIEAYITFNLRYASASSTAAIQTSFISKILLGIMKQYKGFLIVGAGITWFIGIKDMINRWCKCGLILSFIVLICVVYQGGVYPYYFLVIANFSIFLIISLLYYAERNIIATFNSEIIIFSSIVILCLVVNFNYNYRQSKLFNNSISVQEKFACIMREQSDKPTLLNFLWLDSGFYMKTEIIPNVRFFHKLNISYENYPDNFTVQLDAIRNKKVEFVALRDNIDSKCNTPELINNYHVISEQIQEYEGKLYKYYLFKLNE